jgi:hypothetical protein
LTNWRDEYCWLLATISFMSRPISVSQSKPKLACHLAARISGSPDTSCAVNPPRPPFSLWLNTRLQPWAMVWPP